MTLIRVKCTLNELDIVKGQEICIQYNRNTLGCLFKCLCKVCRSGSGRWDESMVDWNQVVPTEEIFRSVPFSNETYGEAKPNLIKDIIQRLKITQKDSFVDLGSGIGNVVMQASMDTGCRAVGIEKEMGRYQAAVRLLKQCRELQPDVHGRVEFYQKDLMVDKDDIEKVLLGATVIFVNNYSFGEELGLKVLDHFDALQEDAIVVTLKSLFGRRKRTRTEGLLNLELSFMGPSDGVSWTSNPIELFVYRKEP
jgi:H3 lysine-79-specific histone-lysine N-methyltransferase